mgnify:CR=1 FL=1
MTTFNIHKNWLDYNFLNEEYYNNFQPIHTAGLFFFNNSFTPNVENPDDDWSYYDAKGNKHKFDDGRIKPREDYVNPESPSFDDANTYRWQRFKRK